VNSLQLYILLLDLVGTAVHMQYIA